MKTTKRTVKLAAVFAAHIVGVFATHTYMESKSPAETDILTPVYEEMGGVIIPETEVPMGPDSADGPGSVAGPGAETTEHPYIQQVVDLLNAEREKAGAPALTVTAELNKAAGIRAEEISTSFSHDRPNGTRYRTVLDENSVSYRYCGENVAMGYRTPADVIAGWMGSDGHKENMLNPSYTSIGIGYFEASNGYRYWARLFIY